MTNLTKQFIDTGMLLMGFVAIVFALYIQQNLVKELEHQNQSLQVQCDTLSARLQRKTVCDTMPTYVIKGIITKGESK